MSARDYRITILIGLASAVLWFFVLARLALLSTGLLIGVVAAAFFLFAIGIIFVHRILRGALFHKLAKFLMVGVLNTGIDFFVFNTLIAASGNDQGWSITLFKSISFICAMINSYELNRLWTFGEESAGVRTKQEFMRFALTTLFGFFINVSVTSFVANSIHPSFGLSQIRWDNVAAIIATALNFVWNFIGYKMFVFKSKTKKNDMTFPNVV